MIEGGSGADVLSGGGSIGDTLSYLNSTAAVKITITFGVTTAATGGDAGGDAGGDSINGFSDVWGSAFNNTVTDTGTLQTG